MPIANEVDSQGLVTTNAYTSNDAAGWKKLADAHVDAIITDDPAGLLPWLRSQQPPLHP